MRISKRNFKIGSTSPQGHCWAVVLQTSLNRWHEARSREVQGWAAGCKVKVLTSAEAAGWQCWEPTHLSGVYIFRHIFCHQPLPKDPASQHWLHLCCIPEGWFASQETHDCFYSIYTPAVNCRSGSQFSVFIRGRWESKMCILLCLKSTLLVF